MLHLGSVTHQVSGRDLRKTRIVAAFYTSFCIVDPNMLLLSNVIIINDYAITLKGFKFKQ